MIIFGISEGTHDASLCVLNGGSILFASQAERYSGVKNDPILNSEIIGEALSFGAPDVIAYYEKPWLKNLRVSLLGGIPSQKSFYKQHPELSSVPVKTVPHHLSHAAAGYYTSDFTDAVVVVLDSIGEVVTSSIWVGEGESLKMVKSWGYPFSYGLYYSAFTDLIGLKPNEEEYILMGMSAYGDSDKYYSKVSKYFPTAFKQKYYFHQGIDDWGVVSEGDRFHIAAAVQRVYEERLLEFMNYAKSLTGKQNLVFMGGCALNSKANTHLWSLFPNVWIMPSPGDSGSAIGAASAVLAKHLDWKSPYLGHEIEFTGSVDDIVNRLLSGEVVAVASGKAEFGPRALGNRSLLADPRSLAARDKLNVIKGREDFRPVAPAVLAEHASEWFDMSYPSPYMQYTPKCLKPDVIPAGVHVDGTSRVQTVSRTDDTIMRKIIEKFYEATGVPVLLNTSMNIKGSPLVNTQVDAELWASMYGLDVSNG